MLGSHRPLHGHVPLVCLIHALLSCQNSVAAVRACYRGRSYRALLLGDKIRALVLICFPSPVNSDHCVITCGTAPALDHQKGHPATVNQELKE